MLRCLLVPILGAFVLSTWLGCSSPTEYPSPVYDTCYGVSHCVVAATRCEELSVDFAGYTHVNAICTLTCETEGSVSPDCPRAWVGRFGSCYPSRVAGGIDEVLICFEPCDLDGDCQLGFRCLGAGGLCGVDDPSCPIEENDAVCVPGPD
jgi:hypothetical protein